MIVTGKAANHFHSQMLLRTANCDAVVPCKSLERMDARERDDPRALHLLLEGKVAKSAPLLEQRSRAIFASEVSSKSLRESATERRRDARFLFSPAVEITTTNHYRTSNRGFTGRNAPASTERESKHSGSQGQ